MRKVLLTIIASLCWALTVIAMPAKPGWQTIKQSDGTTLRVQTIGDEFYSAIVTSDGLTVARGNDGDFYYYSSEAGLMNVRAHEACERLAAEAAFVNARHGSLTLRGSSGPSHRMGGRLGVGGSNAEAGIPALGKRSIPIILVQFQDKKFSNTRNQIISALLAGDVSVGNYFIDQSNGLYEPDFNVYGIYTLSHNREYYGEHVGEVNDKRVGAMVTEAVQLAAAAGMPFVPFDTDNDDYCDVVIIIYAGVGEAQASTTHPEAIWPQHWTLDGAAKFNQGGNGKFRPRSSDPYVNRFAVVNELHGSNDQGTAIDGIGIFCHEFGHCLGLPDMYDVGKSGKYGMGNWDVMADGCYANNTYRPVGYSAYEKNFMGWIEYITPMPDNHFQLPVWNQKRAASDVAFRIYSDVNPKEYFILENRYRQGWDYYLPDDGMLITHVTYDAQRWYNNKVNDEAVQLLTLVPADNVLSKDSEGADLWPVNGKTAFTDSSTPAAKLYMKADGTITGNAGYLGKPVTEMTVNSDGTISFWFMKNGAPAGIVYINTPTFPDAAFRRYLLNRYPNGYLTPSQIESCTSLQLAGMGISSLKGIEHFTALEELDCQNNNLTSLDLSKNANLVNLNCSHNGLSSLNVNSCVNLKELVCSDNRLDTLNTRNLSKMETLDCDENRLVSLTLPTPSSFSALSSLNCSSNRFTKLVICNYPKLAFLIVCDNMMLTSFSCSGNPLWQFFVTNNPVLDKLYCYGSSLLTKLDLTGTANLTVLDCSYSPKLATITGLDECYELKSLDVSGCAFTKLDGLDRLDNLEVLHAHHTKLTSIGVTGKSKLASLYLHENPDLKAVWAFENSSLKVLSCSFCPSLQQILCFDCALADLNVTGDEALMDLSCGGNANLADITGLEQCVSITTLDCESCNISDLSAVKNMGNLESLYVNNNRLAALDVSGCSKLDYIDCCRNMLSGEGMDRLVQSLPERTEDNMGYFYVLHNTDEGNTMTNAQIVIAKNKYWLPKKYNGSGWETMTAAVNGDVNADGSVNITDINVLIDAILCGGDGWNDALDVNGDGTVNISDVNAVIVLILYQ